VLLHDNSLARRRLAGGSEPQGGDERGEPEKQALLLLGSPFALEAGLRLVFAAEDHAVVTLPVPRRAGGEAGQAQPGAITALVEAAAAAAARDFLERRDAAARGLSVNFVRPESEPPLVAEARVLASDADLRSCEVDVRDWNGTLVAKAFLTYGAGRGG
jgi:uncharacterized protein (TIGR00369 family)